MRYQTDPGWPDAIRLYGCYFLTLVRMGEIEAGAELTQAQVIALYFDLLKAGAVITDATTQCYIKQPEVVTNNVFRRLGKPLSCRQLGVITGGAFEFWPATRIYAALEGKTQKAEHWRLGNYKGVEIYNSWPAIPIVREGRRIIYQVVSR